MIYARTGRSTGERLTSTDPASTATADARNLEEKMPSSFIEDRARQLREGSLQTLDEIRHNTGSSPPALPGVYAWWFREGCLSMVPVKPCPHRDGYRLLYIGITAATRRSNTTLCDRIVYCHVRGRATNSTLRTSLGLLLEHQLGTRPTRISSRNWHFEGEAEKALSDWMARNAAVSWVTVNELQDRRALEDHLIESCRVPMNLKGNRKHPFYETLYALRRAADARTGTSAKLAG